MIKGFLLAAIVASVFMTTSSTWIGGMTSNAGISSNNLSYLDMSQNISSQIAIVETTLNTTTTSSESSSGFDYGGLWASVQSFLKTPELYSTFMTSLSQVLPGVEVLVVPVMAIISGLFLYALIMWIRSGDPL